MATIVDRSRRLLAERGPSAFGFYTSGQLFLEEYYTLAMLARAGIGTAPSGWEHAHVHGHSGCGPEGELRRGWQPWLLRGPRRL